MKIQFGKYVFAIAQFIRKYPFLRRLNLRYNIPLVDLIVRNIPTIERKIYKRIYKNPYLAKVNNYLLYINLEDEEALMLFNRPYERRETAVFEFLCLKRNGAVIFDIGANYGYYSVIASAIASDSKIIAFEPNDELTVILERTFALCKNKITLVKKAVSESTKQGLFYVSETWSGDGRVSPDLFQDRRSKPVEFVSLDDYSKQYLKGLTIGLIKVDIQGNEPNLFWGAKKIFQKQNSHILLEFSPSHLEQAGFSAALFLQKISEQFKVMDIMTGNILRFENLNEIVQWCEKVRFSFEASGDGYTNLILQKNGDYFDEIQDILRKMPFGRH